MKEQQKKERGFTLRYWLIGSGLVAVSACITLFVLVTLGNVAPSYQRSAVDVQKPIKVSLNQKLLRISETDISIEPRVSGTWQVKRSLLGNDELIFIHDKPLITATTYKINLAGVKRFHGASVKVPDVSFTTEAAPGVAATSFDASKVVAADFAFTVKLAKKNRGLTKLQLATIPAIPLVHSEHGDDTYKWAPKGYLPQGKKLTVLLKDANSGKQLMTKKLTVAAMPRVTQMVKRAYFAKDDKAVIKFAEPIDQKSGKITFGLPGKGAWSDAKTYIFTPDEVVPGKTYSYRIPKGLRTVAGGVLPKAQSYNFSTPGAVRVVSMSPYGSELSQNEQTFRFDFDQPVDRTSAEERFHTSHGTVTSKTWQGNTLVIAAVKFGAQETVRGWIDAGVKPIFGLASVSSFEVSFTTEIPIKKLNVPQYYQQYAQSCEAASVRMALAYKGIGVGSDMTILQKFGYHPRPYDKKRNVWDDPQLQFVGDVNGNQGKLTGWGVYAEPVAAAIRSYGRGAAVQYGVSTGFVASQIHAGNPVVLWGIWDDSATQKSWKTPGGRTVSGPIPMHVRLVVGVKGKASSPVGFYINDPINGTLYWTAGELAYNVSRAGSANQAVAVQ